VLEIPEIKAEDLAYLTDEERAELDRLLAQAKLDAGIQPRWFHDFQRLAWTKRKPILAIAAAWQSGKTVFLPPWLKREIQECGPGDYGAFSSTFKLLNRKFLPELKKEFKDLAEWKAGDQQFHFTEEGSKRLWGDGWKGDPTIIQLGHAENPDSLESATLKAVAWDEPGQRLVPEQSFLTVESRLMVNRGRMALASRFYQAGWWERLTKGQLADPSRLDVVSFPSWANPLNPQADDPYWAELRNRLPAWLYAILYEGKFERPANVIYDTFDYDEDTEPDFDISPDWPLYVGMDFGPVNTAAVVLAEDKSNNLLWVIAEYHTGKKLEWSKLGAEIAALTGDRAGGRAFVGGAGGNKTGEEGWREAMRKHHIPLDEPPVGDVEVQIQCVYSELATKKLKFFRKGCAKLIDDIGMYSRETGDDMEASDKIADKSKWHRLDALRGIVTKLRPPKAPPKKVPFKLVKL
jgi:hypothetical protein